MTYFHTWDTQTYFPPPPVVAAQAEALCPGFSPQKMWEVSEVCVNVSF